MLGSMGICEKYWRVIRYSADFSTAAKNDLLDLLADEHDRRQTVNVSPIL